LIHRSKLYIIVVTKRFYRCEMIQTFNTHLVEEKNRNENIEMRQRRSSGKSEAYIITILL